MLGTFLKMMPLIVPSAGVLDHARNLHLGHQCSFWDALVFSACIDAGVNRVYSEDLPGGRVQGLEIKNPFEG